jgi:hypothetical protein
MSTVCHCFQVPELPRAITARGINSREETINSETMDMVIKDHRATMFAKYRMARLVGISKMPRLHLPHSNRLHPWVIWMTWDLALKALMTRFHFKDSKETKGYA